MKIFEIIFLWVLIYLYDMVLYTHINEKHQPDKTMTKFERQKQEKEVFKNMLRGDIYIWIAAADTEVRIAKAEAVEIFRAVGYEFDNISIQHDQGNTHLSVD